MPVLCNLFRRFWKRYYVVHNAPDANLGRCIAEGAAMTWQERMTIDPAVLVGKPIVKGTRISVEFVIDLLGRAGPPPMS